LADEPHPLSSIRSDKQRKFVLAYIGEARFNATRAATLAGYRDAEQSGYELKKKPEIRACIDAMLRGYALTSTEILAELRDVALRGLDESVEVRGYGENVTARMDASSKMKALELLGKHQALFTDNVQVSGGISIEIVGVDTAAMLGQSETGGDR
jgi:phage terminase small subunit